MQGADVLPRLPVVAGDHIHVTLEDTLRSKGERNVGPKVVCSKPELAGASLELKACRVGILPRDVDRQANTLFVDERRPMFRDIALRYRLPGSGQRLGAHR